MRRLITLSFIGLFLGSLAGCATGAKPEAMVPVSASTAPVTSSQTGASTVYVGQVTGGQETNPLWTSQIDNNAYAGALTEALRARGLLAPSGAGRFRVDATLVKIHQPIAGFTLKVTTTVHYRVTNTATSAVLMDEDIVAEGSAKTSDAFFAYVRLRLANEASGKANIEAFVNRLIAVLNAQAATS